MAIARGTGTQTATANSGTTLTINKPTGTAVGDLLWAFMVAQGSSAVWTTPSGWTQAAAIEVFTSGGNCAAFYRIADGSEGASFVFTYGTTIVAGSGGIDRYTGVDQVTPIDVAASTNLDDTGTNTAPVGLSITTVTDGAMLIMGIVANSATTNITPALTESWQVTTVKRSESADSIQSTAGASGNKTGALGAGKTWGTILGALRPATSGITLNPPVATATALDPIPGLIVSITPPVETASASSTIPTLRVTLLSPVATSTAQMSIPLISTGGLVIVSPPPATATAQILLPAIGGDFIFPTPKGWPGLGMSHYRAGND